MVAEQRETVQRIAADTIDIAENVSGAQRELLKYYASISSNRWLMLKVFGVLIVFVRFPFIHRCRTSLTICYSVPYIHPCVMIEIIPLYHSVWINVLRDGLIRLLFHALSVRRDVGLMRKPTENIPTGHLTYRYSIDSSSLRFRSTASLSVTLRVFLAASMCFAVIAFFRHGPSTFLGKCLLEA